MTPFRSLSRFAGALLLAGAVVFQADAQTDPPVPPAPSDPAPSIELETAPERPRKDPPGEFRRHTALQSRADGRVLVIYTIADAARNDFIATSFEMPFTSRTRKEVAAESKTNPSLKMLPALLTIRTRTGEWRTTDSEIRDWPRMRELRSSIRQSVPSNLVEAMERMRGTVFAITAGDIFYQAVARYVIYQDESEPLVPHLEEVTLPPSCVYDNGFGYPCTAEQEARIKAAREAGKPPGPYW